MFLMSKGALLDLEDDENNTALALSIKAGHANYAVMLVQKGANVMNTLKVTKNNETQQYYNNSGFGGYQFGSSLFGQRNPQYGLFGQNNYSQYSALPEGKYSMFKAAIIQGWQGLAYLLLFNGYPYMLAMQDAMTQNKFLLVKTLLAKVSDNSVLQQVNENDQNLFHTLAIYGAHADNNITAVICDQLIERGVDVHAIDKYKRNPLHYAAKNDYYSFVKILLDNGVRHDIKDVEGFCPLAHAICSSKINGALAMLKIFQRYGASFNFKFQEKWVTVTPLLHSIKEQAPVEIIKFLLENGCSLQETDSLGRNAIMYALINNDSSLVRALITEKTLSFSQFDLNGRNCLHYAVQPLSYGSFENLYVLRLLLEHHCKDNSADINGITPYMLACNQRSGRVLEVLEEYGIKENKPQKMDFSDYEAEDDEFDFLNDAEEYIKVQKDIRKVSNKIRKPDENGSFPEYYQVIDDYDIIMTKVDLSCGPYSAYVFYRMQLLIDTNRSVYVLYTR